jgi:hypothetical protein
MEFHTMSTDDTIESLRREVAELRARFRRVREDRREERRTARRQMAPATRCSVDSPAGQTPEQIRR